MYFVEKVENTVNNLKKHMALLKDHVGSNKGPKLAIL